MLHNFFSFNSFIHWIWRQPHCLLHRRPPDSMLGLFAHLIWFHSFFFKRIVRVCWVSIRRHKDDCGLLTNNDLFLLVLYLSPSIDLSNFMAILANCSPARYALTFSWDSTALIQSASFPVTGFSMPSAP